MVRKTSAQNSNSIDLRKVVGPPIAEDPILSDLHNRLSNKVLHCIFDYGGQKGDRTGDLAYAEIMDQLAGRVPFWWKEVKTPVPSFDTISTGFVLAQLALAPRPINTPSWERIFYVNCAPRKDRPTARRKNNEGEPLVWGVLNNGAHVIAVNSGNTLSFLRTDFRYLFETSVKKGGSQFRSRDNFPRFVGKLARHEDFSDLLRRRFTAKDLLAIPKPPKSVIGYVDSFGNMKLTIRADDPQILRLKPGTELTIVIAANHMTERGISEDGGIHNPASLATGSFNVFEGQLALAPGSSGHNNRFLEIFLRGGSAVRAYRYPRAGDKVSIFPRKLTA